MVLSSSEDVTRATHGPPKRLSRNYLREIAGNLVKSSLYVLIFKRRFVALSAGKNYNGCVSVSFNSLFISLPLFTKQQRDNGDERLSTLSTFIGCVVFRRLFPFHSCFYSFLRRSISCYFFIFYFTLFY